LFINQEKNEVLSFHIIHRIARKQYFCLRTGMAKRALFAGGGKKAAPFGSVSQVLPAKTITAAVKRQRSF
jgi:hypothetical protein